MKTIVGTPLARLRCGARAVLGRKLSREELTALDGYVGLLLSWQRRYRLVGSTSVGWIVDELLLDSLLFARFLPSPSASVLDLGSGAGIPGIPLKITSPGIRLALLEARRHRASFLATAVRALELQEVRVIGSRADEALREHPDLERGFEIVVSRAAGSLEEIVKVGSRFVAPGGTVVVAGPPLARDRSDTAGWVMAAHPTKGVQRAFFITAIS